MTIFSGLRPVPELVGINAAELVQAGPQPGLKKKVQEAFQNAAKEFFKQEAQTEVPEKMSDVKSVRMYPKAKQ